MIKISSETIDVQEIISSVASPESGAIDVFIGATRNHAKGRAVTLLEYEAYEPMALKIMEEIVAEAFSRWTLQKAAIVHRVGRVEVGDASVVIAVSSAHRDEAFRASRFLIDRLKEVVPIWKKEYFADGSIEWSKQSHEQVTAQEQS